MHLPQKTKCRQICQIAQNALIYTTQKALYVVYNDDFAYIWLKILKNYLQNNGFCNIIHSEGSVSDVVVYGQLNLKAVLTLYHFPD